MKKFLLSVFVTFNTVILFAQNPADAVYVFSGGVLRTMNVQNKKIETEGSCYYNDEWSRGDIELFSGEIIKDYPLKYDMKNKQIDILVNDEVKFVTLGAVKEIKWLLPNGNYEVMKNVSQYKDYSGSGFFSILIDGKVTFMEKTDLMLLESNYNAAMDVGSEKNKYIKKKKFYAQKDNQLIEIKKTKKSVTKLLSDQKTKIEEYVIQNKLSFKNEIDLIKVFNYYNNI
jgi:hypothetical protein